MSHTVASTVLYYVIRNQAETGYFLSIFSHTIELYVCCFGHGVGVEVHE